MKKKSYLYYIDNSQDRKRLALIIILAAVLILIIYFAYFNRKTAVIIPESKPQQFLLDTRFLVLYGKVTKINTDSINIEVIKEPTLTDYFFDNLKNIDVDVEEKTVIKNFDTKTKVYSDLTFLDIKTGKYITAYINNSTSSGYKAVGLKVFSENINK
jgi:hypothetical protein